MLSWDGESPLFISAVELETRMGKNTTPQQGQSRTDARPLLRMWM